MRIIINVFGSILIAVLVFLVPLSCYSWLTTNEIGFLILVFIGLGMLFVQILLMVFVNRKVKLLR